MHYHPPNARKRRPASPVRVPHREPHLLTSETLSAAPVPPASAAVGFDASLDRVEAELKAIKAQAQATHDALERLKRQDAGESHTEVAGDGLASPVLDWVLWGGCALLLLAAALLWSRRTRRPPHLHTEGPITVIPEPDKFYGDSVAPPVLDGDDPDPWVPPKAPDQVFDLEAAASEVARVRKTLAERRRARALQREEDVQKLKELVLQAQSIPLAPMDIPLWQDDEPKNEPQNEPNHELSDAPVEPLPAAMDLPLELPETLEEAPVPVLVPAPAADVPIPEFEDNLHHTMEQDYAITLALAHESEAVDLWDEARELATEVLESSNPGLKEQANALLARLDELAKQKALESRLWGYTP